MNVNELKNYLKKAISITHPETSRSCACDVLIEFLDQIDPEIGVLFMQAGKTEEEWVEVEK